MNKSSKIIIIISLVLFLGLNTAINRAFSRDMDPLDYKVDDRTIDTSYKRIKASDGKDEILNYSGKTVVWEGELVRKILNDAYFEYILKMDSGDECRILSGRGIDFKAGDHIRVKGIILVKEGRFSHLVLNEVEHAPIKVKTDFTSPIPGLIPLEAPEQVVFNRIYSWILYYNPGISRSNATFIANRIVHYCRVHKQDPFLVTALMSAESAFNMNAVSPAGAIGLGQLMPGTASALGVNPYHPEQNIEGAVRYLGYQMKRWGGSGRQMVLALASYNAGPGAVEKYGGIPPYRETIDYVNFVSALYYQIRKK